MKISGVRNIVKRIKFPYYGDSPSARADQMEEIPLMKVQFSGNTSTWQGDCVLKKPLKYNNYNGFFDLGHRSQENYNFLSGLIWFQFSIKNTSIKKRKINFPQSPLREGQSFKFMDSSITVLAVAQWTHYSF